MGSWFNLSFMFNVFVFTSRTYSSFTQVGSFHPSVVTRSSADSKNDVSLHFSSTRFVVLLSLRRLLRVKQLKALGSGVTEETLHTCFQWQVLISLRRLDAVQLLYCLFLSVLARDASSAAKLKRASGLVSF